MPKVDFEFIHVCTFIHSKRQYSHMSLRAYIFNGLTWLIIEFNAQSRSRQSSPYWDTESKSPSDCNIDLCSILWVYCRLWFIVSDDERFDFERINIFHWKTVISTAVISLQSYLLHRFAVKPVIPFLYISPILLVNIVGVEVNYDSDNIVTAALTRI